MRSTDDDRPPFIPPDVRYVECYICGRHIEDFSRVEGLDVSADDAYYPEMVPVCRDGNHRSHITGTDQVGSP